MSMMKTRQQGVGMVEILVALLVLAIGVLGYAGLQLSALKGAETAHMRARATALARDTLERMMVNPEASSFYQTESSWSGDAPGAGEAPEDRTRCVGITKTCTSKNVAEWDIQQLAWQAANTMPAGRIATMPCTMSGAASSCVVIAWGDQNIDDCMTSAGIETQEGSHCVVMEVMR